MVITLHLYLIEGRLSKYNPVGYDDIKLMKYLNNLGVKYIIRMTDNRKVKYQSKTLTAKQLRLKCKGKINEKFESGEDKYELKLSHLKVTLCSDNKTKLYSVVVHGFSEDPLKSMILLTNCEIRGKNDVKQVFWRYMKRWGIEETFRYNKNEYGYENIRVRSMHAMQNMINALHITNMIMIKIIDSQTSILGLRIIEASKSLRDDVTFQMYQISKGVSMILRHGRTSLKKYLVKEKVRFKQLTLNI